MKLCVCDVKKKPNAFSGIESATSVKLFWLTICVPVADIVAGEPVEFATAGVQ